MLGLEWTGLSDGLYLHRVAGACNKKGCWDRWEVVEEKDLPKQRVRRSKLDIECDRKADETIARWKARKEAERKEHEKEKVERRKYYSQCTLILDNDCFGDIIEPDGSRAHWGVYSNMGYAIYFRSVPFEKVFKQVLRPKQM